MTPTWERLANPRGLLRIGQRDTLDQAIGARFKVLCKADEGGDAKGIFAAFDTADGLRMDADQLGKALLRQIRPQSGVGHVAANDAEDFLVRHPCLWSV